jgi:hypothetical protein
MRFKTHYSNTLILPHPVSVNSWVYGCKTTTLVPFVVSGSNHERVFTQSNGLESRQPPLIISEITILCTLGT